MLRPRVLAMVCAASILTSAPAQGDPSAEPAPPSNAAPAPSAFVHSGVPTTLCRREPSWKCRDLPPGFFLDEARWAALDAEVRRLQGAETRLGAENKSLRDSAGAWSPGWRTLVLAAVLGAALGAYAVDKL